MSGRLSSKITKYVDSKIITILVAVCIITGLVWLNISVERKKLGFIEKSLEGYMGYLKNMIFSSTYDALKKGNMKLFTNLLNEIGEYEYVHEFSLLTPAGKIIYSSDPKKMGHKDSNVKGLTDKKEFSDFQKITYYYPVLTTSYCTRCHTSWHTGGINSFYKVALSRKALVDISQFSYNSYYMAIFSGIIMVIFFYMFFYMIKKKVSEDAVKESERKFRSLFENIMDVQYSTDIRGNLTLISPSGVKLLGYDTEDEMKRYGLGQSMFFDAEERSKFLRTLSREGEVKNYEIRLRTKDNAPIIVEMNTKVIYDSLKKPVAIEGIFRDITYRKEYERQIHLMGIIFDTTMESIVITNERGVINQVNPAFTEITGYKPQEIIGKNIKLLRSSRHTEGFYLGVQKTLLRTGRWSGEVWNRKANGEIFPEWTSATTITDKESNKKHYVLVSHDITELKNSEERLKHQAYHDQLTGLPNRGLLKDRMDMAMAYCSRHEKQMALLFIDLDNFKNINDNAGHHVGDMYLQHIGHILNSACREEDTVARVGGDEFVILLPDVESEESALNVARRIFEQFGEPVLINDYRLQPAASIGIAFYPKDADNPIDLLRAADMAMYYAKEQGKGDFVTYRSSMDTSDVDKLGLEADIRRGLLKREFVMYYQPVVSMKDGEIKGFESLIRWKKDGGELLPPSSFIDIAEQSSLITSIGQFGLTETCKTMRKINKMGFDHLSFSVNVSSRQFQNPSFPDQVKDIIEKSQVRPHKLILEITENTVIQDVKAAIDTMKDLKSFGVRLSLDDFGTGYSSLAYLKEFPISILKIDKTFTRELRDNIGEQHITDAIISLSKNFGMLVIAEGVEEYSQIEYLSKLDCDFVQGFYFAKPMSESDMIELLQSGRKLELPS